MIGSKLYSPRTRGWVPPTTHYYPGRAGWAQQKQHWALEAPACCLFARHSEVWNRFQHKFLCQNRPVRSKVCRCMRMLRSSVMLLRSAREARRPMVCAHCALLSLVSRSLSLSLLCEFPVHGKLLSSTRPFTPRVGGCAVACVARRPHTCASQMFATNGAPNLAPSARTANVEVVGAL